MDTTFSLNAQALVPDSLNEQYQRLVLLDSTADLADLDAQCHGASTLFVFSDWVSWRLSAAEGLDCVYFEAGLIDWAPPVDLVGDMLIRANDWYFDGDVDVTRFADISLGRQFGGEMSMRLMNFYRMDAAIRGLVQRFKPTEIIYVEFRNDIDYLDAEHRRWIVSHFAEESGIPFVDCSNMKQAAPERHDKVDQAPSSKFSLKTLCVFAYTSILEMATWARALAHPSRPRVLILMNTNVLEPLVRRFNAHYGISPIVRSRTIPKQLSLLLHCLWQGVMLIDFTEKALSAADREHIGKIEKHLRTLAKKQDDWRLMFLRSIANREIVDRGRIADTVKTVRMAERLLDHHRPIRIVVDGVRNPPVRIIADLAHFRGIGVDYIWHSAMIPEKQKFDGVAGDKRIVAPTTRILSWGQAHEDWIRSICGEQPCVRVGSPLAERYRVADTSAHGGQPKLHADAKVLLLQYTPNVTDPVGLNHFAYQHFVAVAGYLRDNGIRHIRIKLHPGPDRFSKSYFELIADTFGIVCEIAKAEPFHECVRWADWIIGPLATGALFESLAARKPYYAFMIPPHSMDCSYYGDFPIFETISQLDEALRNRPDPDGAAALESIYSSNSIPDTAETFWNAVALADTRSSHVKS